MKSTKPAKRKASDRGHRKHRSGKGRLSLQLTGTVQMTREGSLYVIIEGDGEDDVFVPSARTMGALNGDTVRVAVSHAGSVPGRREGRVVEILERSTKPYVGIFHTVGSQAWVIMQSRNMPYDIEVGAEDAALMGAQRGMKVAVLVDRFNRHESTPKGHLTDVLGFPGDNDTEMHAILAEFNLPYRFEPEVEMAAKQIPAQITEADLKDRKDFRDRLTFTIDPTDAKDFDDALSFCRLPNGNYEVGVHIADVSHYVLPDSIIDKEARARGTSVYLVDRTVPMLPEALCNNLCSLRPDEDKLTFSGVFEMTPDAKVRKTWLGRTVIRSKYRLDYAAAQTVIEKYCPEKTDRTGGSSDQSIPAELSTLEDAIVQLNRIAQILREKRFKAGAINFDRPEMKVEINEQGRAVNVYEKHSCEANWLIEEFMLLCAKSVATFVSGKNKTFVYRVHDEPQEAKLQGLRDFAKGFGYKMNDKLEGKSASKALAKLLSDSAGKPENTAFTELALRSMAKAKYSTDDIGHYGLAFEHYTHFTSPIRRYPDLMAHRLLAEYLKNGKSADKDTFEAECVYASARENIAADAERTSVKYKLVEYMQGHVGEEFSGQISSLTEWGMYVKVEPTHIEGMVPLRTIRSDWFEFDEKTYSLRGRRTRKVYKLGDAVHVRVESANLEQRLLDFSLVEK